MIFPTLNSYDIIKHHNANTLYNGYNLIDKNNLLRDFEINQKDHNEINEIIKEIKENLIKSIELDPKNNDIIKTIDGDKFGETDKNEFFKQFINNRQNCTKLNVQICDSLSVNCVINIDKLKIIRRIILNSLQNKYDYNDFIFNNLEKFVLLMKINFTLSILKQLSDNLTCWDFQKYINDIDNSNVNVDASINKIVNNNYNFNIQPFGLETIEHITLKDFKNIFSDSSKLMNKLCDYVFLQNKSNISFYKH